MIGKRYPLPLSEYRKEHDNAVNLSTNYTKMIGIEFFLCQIEIFMLIKRLLNTF